MSTTYEIWTATDKNGVSSRTIAINAKWLECYEGEVQDLFDGHDDAVIHNITKNGTIQIDDPDGLVGEDFVVSHSL